MRLRIAANALLGFSAFAMAAPPQGGGPTAAPLDAELAAIAGDPAHPLASLSVLAIRGGRVVYERQFGRRFIDGVDSARDRRADERTLYRIASISKLVTTLGVMRLVEDGKLALDADLGGYLGYRVRNPHFPDTPITMRMLLTHTSSLRDDVGYFWEEGRDIRDVLTPGGALHGGGAMWSPKAKPGEYFSYANLPWGVIGTVMEKVSGERFDRLMKRLVLDPLGMGGGFNPAEMPHDRLSDVATLYRKRLADDDAPWNPAGPWVAQVDDYSAAAPVPRAGPTYAIGSNGTLFGPQGNLRASARDLGRLMRMLMDGGVLDGRRFVKAETVDAMLSLQWRDNGGGNGNAAYGGRDARFNAWGLGVQYFLDVTGAGRGDRLVEGGGFTGVGHHGTAWGLTGVFVFDRASRDGLIFLAGGPGFDPARTPGKYSAFHRYEERVMSALHRHAIARRAD